MPFYRTPTLPTRPAATQPRPTTPAQLATSSTSHQTDHDVFDAHHTFLSAPPTNDAHTQALIERALAVERKQTQQFFQDQMETLFARLGARDAGIELPRSPTARAQPGAFLFPGLEPADSRSAAPAKPDPELADSDNLFSDFPPANHLPHPSHQSSASYVTPSFLPFTLPPPKAVPRPTPTTAVPTFSGDKAHAEVWLYRIEAYFSLWRDTFPLDSDRLNAVYLSLGDQAGLWFNNGLRQRQPWTRSWEEFKVEFSRFFASTETYSERYD